MAGKRKAARESRAFRDRGNWQSVAVTAAMAWLLGCAGEPTAPFDELPLRDALQATPQAIGQLPEPVRQELADRFEQAHVLGGAALSLRDVNRPGLAPLLREADLQRQSRGEDAIVLASVELLASGAEVHPVTIDDAESIPSELPTLEGASAPTAAIERTAMEGRAGVVVAQLWSRFGARRLVRMTQLPAGVVVVDDTIYVNAAWLVALAGKDARTAPQSPELELTEPDHSAPRPRASTTRPDGAAPRPVSGPGPASRPLGLEEHNPYKLPTSVVACETEVRDRCACIEAGRCEDAEPVDPSFATAQEECDWVGQDDSHASALCILALLSIDTLAECVRDAPPFDAHPPCPEVGDREAAVEFALNEACVTTLDNCLRYGQPTEPDYEGCVEEACHCACRRICEKDKKASAAPDSSKDCSVPSHHDRSPPFGSVLWLVAPLVLAFLMARRRS